MKQTQEDRLRLWIESLEKDKIVNIALECIEELIIYEVVNFYDDTKVPYWDATGERLDGMEYEEE